MYTSKKKQVIKKQKQKQTRKQTKSKKQTQTKSKKQIRRRKQIGKGLSKKEKKEKKKEEKEKKEKEEKEKQVKEEKRKEEKKKKLKELMNKEHWHCLIIFGKISMSPKEIYSDMADKVLSFINKLSKINLTLQNGKVKLMNNIICFYTTENIIDKEKLDDFGYITINPYN